MGQGQERPAAERAIAALHSFVPTGEEHADVARLYAIVDGLEGEQARAAVPAMLGVFERHPRALLGSPGPLVHCIETTGMDAFLPELLESFRKVPASMTWWMISRCLRSDPPPELVPRLLQTLRAVRAYPEADHLRDDIDEVLRDHPPARLRLV